VIYNGLVYGYITTLMNYTSPSLGLASACFFAFSALRNYHQHSFGSEGRREHTIKAIMEGKMVAAITHPMLKAKDSIPLIGVLSPIKP
jgi:hypothetical protein